jgi:methylated-DNA-protein-cysteine methyltransferase-like protein
VNFNERVYALVRQVPRGRVVSYGDVAAAMGAPRAARQVGRALSALGRWGEPPGGPVPWQRVIRRSGDLPFAGDPSQARSWAALLVREGVEVIDGRVQMATWRWRPEPGEWLDPALLEDAC